MLTRLPPAFRACWPGPTWCRCTWRSVQSPQGLVDASFLAAMRPGALFVNVARGGLVNEDALADALDSDHLGGAALDVRADEPPSAGRLERNEKVVLTPHVAGLTDEAQARVVEMLAGDLSAVLQGDEATHPAGCGAFPSANPLLDDSQLRRQPPPAIGSLPAYGWCTAERPGARRRPPGVGVHPFEIRLGGPVSARGEPALRSADWFAAPGKLGFYHRSHTKSEGLSNEVRQVVR